MRLKGFAARAIRDYTVQSTARPKNIVTLIDFSPASKKALKYAFRFAEKFFRSNNVAACFGAAAIVKLCRTCRTHPPFLENCKAQRREELARTDWFDTANGSAAAHLNHNVDGMFLLNEIVELAKEADIDLIVIAGAGATPARNISA